MNWNGLEIQKRLTIHVCDNCDLGVEVEGYHYYNEKCPKCGGNVKLYVVDVTQFLEKV